MDINKEFVERWLVDQIFLCPKALEVFRAGDYMAAREHLKREWGEGADALLNEIRRILFQLHVASLYRDVQPYTYSNLAKEIRDESYNK